MSKTSQAKRVSSTRRLGQTDKKKRDRLLLQIVLVSIIIIACIGVGRWVLNKMIPSATEKKETAAQISKQPPIDKPTVKPIKPLDENDASLPKNYRFYTDLLDREVPIESDKIGGQAPQTITQQTPALPPLELLSLQSAPTTDLTPTKVGLRIASFKQLNTAEALINTLKQHKLSAKITKHQNLHMVTLEPLTPKQAEAAKKLLQQLNFQPIEYALP